MVQETLARTIEALHADRVPDHVPLTHFLYGIARHVIADEIRRRVEEARHMLDDFERAGNRRGWVAKRETDPLFAVVNC